MDATSKRRGKPERTVTQVFEVLKLRNEKQRRSFTSLAKLSQGKTRQKYEYVTRISHDVEPDPVLGDDNAKLESGS